MPESGRPKSEDPAPRTSPGLWSLHLWQIQPVRDAMVLVAIFGVLYLGYRLSIVTVPILLAMLLAYLIEPLVKLVTRKGWFTRRGFALLLIFGTFGLIVIPAAAGITYGVMRGADYTQQLSGHLQATIASVEAPDDPALEKRVGAAPTPFVLVKAPGAVEHGREVPLQEIAAAVKELLG